MTVRIYRSSDYNAPTINNAAGQLISVLDACLVTGYGDQTITITRSGTVATATTTNPHGLNSIAKYTISGANEPEYNGEHSIIITGGKSFTFEVGGTPASPATGTITGRLAGSGWTKPYTDTNKAVYTQGAGNGMSLMVDDTTIVTAMVSGYETSDGIDSGTGKFPTSTQYYMHKSTTATLQDWVIVADESTFFYWINLLGTTHAAYMHHFGDFNSLKVGDIFNTIISVSHLTSTSTGNLFGSLGAISTAHLGNIIARSYTQIGTGVTASRGYGSALESQSYMASGNLTYPHPIDNGLYLSDIRIGENVGSIIRGTYKGLKGIAHTSPLSNYSIFNGNGGLAGKTYMALDVDSGTANSQLIIEISDTW